MSRPAKLQQEMEATARRLALPIDQEVYRSAGRDPWLPIPYAGNPKARVCIVGRDLGKAEVGQGQPLVGASGRAVRQGILRALGTTPTPHDPWLEAALPHALLCNLVPYKPIGNRAFSAEAREAFRPLLERILVEQWQGEAVLTLGNEACDWFEAYSVSPWRARPALERYSSEIPCQLGARRWMVCPLPHPSPANATWRKHFPKLLARRLQKWL